MSDGRVPTAVLLPDIENAKLALRETTSVEGLRGFREAAALAEIYAKAHESRDAYLLAAEVRIWTERRAGEIRRDLPRLPGRRGHAPFDFDEAQRLYAGGLTWKQVAHNLGVDTSTIKKARDRGWTPWPHITSVIAKFDEEFGVARTVAERWEILAGVPEEDLQSALEDTKARDGSFATLAVLRRIGTTPIKRLEPGIYVTQRGKIKLQWSRDGLRHSKILDHADLERARKQLADLRGKTKPRQPSRLRHVVVGDSISSVRMSLEYIERLDWKITRLEAKSHIVEATRLLHLAEDELVEASLLA